MDAVSIAQNSISNREREILILVAQGFTNMEIGERLSITRTTVRRHLENIFAKLRVHDRTEAVVKYFFSLKVRKCWVTENTEIFPTRDELAAAQTLSSNIKIKKAN